MSRVVLVSYATRRFLDVRQELEASASRFGIGEVRSYTEEDLVGTEFHNQNLSILSERCGAGYWAWKPYFIHRTLAELDDGDVLLYCDAGSLLTASPQPLLDLARRQPQGLVLFDARPLTNRQFTKRDCFVRMGCDSAEYWNANKLIATLLLVRKCEFAVSFVGEWLHHAQDRAALTDDPNVCGLPDLPGFLQHRHDQAILSVLAAKHRVETYRNPALWGNYLKLPAFRVSDESTPSPYGLVSDIKGYAAVPQANSPYGTLFEINRQPNWEGKTPIKLAPPRPRKWWRKLAGRLGVG